MSKIAHFHIGENKYDYENKCWEQVDPVVTIYRSECLTLICTLLEGGHLDYTLYSGWSSSGTRFALTNLPVDLPVYKSHPEQTEEEFVQELVDRINETNLYRVVKQVEKVTFK
tara:strand:- start:1480 stop:1818 length:339 start_codon:yes stop_codon:yes gene_type:complete